ncbi:ABC transporter permease [Mucilaginibacter sp. L3T2-6]|uniref:ABC transporter permease n=1 Tax=Mucilaginibacter sp. L3T2-6 TaxID=3062491 RepID=UPI0026756E63|nr:ABC transporter permease [Mucilaginibacter sp. L3T2-6]MDO3643379.1 ABC transporter permease [Mucilaginibacter sp. L3T2-6]MDV6215688.1 FtsX-like permease family protein [Mucilaginibacter sp. L3T2-6]
MFKHLFKLIWNKKKQNFLLMSEMLVSFLVIFAVFTLMVYYYTNYKKPIGLDYENLWLVSYNNTNPTKSTDSLNLYYETLRQEMKAMPQVKDVSYCSSNVPFSNNQWTGDAHYKKASPNTNYYIADDDYKKALNLKILEGRWFEKGDAASKNQAVIINDVLKEKLFGNEDPIGKLIGRDEKKMDMKVVGVIQSIKTGGDYSVAQAGLYQRADTGSYHGFGSMMVKVSPTADAAFEGRLYKLLANYMKNSHIEIEHMANKKRSSNLFSLVPMIITLIVACFLIINVALGLFGVMWYNINKRRGEIGLRRAIGATGKSVSSQLVTESVILATLSLIVGTFFAVQFPLLNVFNLQAGIYLAAMALAIVFIYLLVLVCSLYPGKQAAAIYPAVALHEE